MDPVDLSVIAPMHNEEGNALSLYQAISDTMAGLKRSYEIIFVNDASTDRTLSIMKQIQSRDPHFHFIDLAANVGENWALLAGISKARGTFIITIDGDGQNDPAYIPELLKELSRGYRVVSGWRKKRTGDFWTRRLPSLVANGLIRAITGVAVHDCGCGLKVYRREILEGRYVPKGFMNRFSPVVLGVKNHEFSEVEIADRLRKSGRSHYGIERVFIVLRDLLTLPFAVRGPGSWLQRFCWMEWLGVIIGVLLLAAGWRFSAVGFFLLALVSFSNTRNLRRFVEAQAKPQFQIREFR